MAVVWYFSVVEGLFLEAHTTFSNSSQLDNLQGEGVGALEHCDKFWTWLEE